MSKKKTHKEYVEELKIKNPNVEVVGIYCGANIKIPHRCKNDGHEWKVAPGNILSGTGCPLCAGTIKKTHEKSIQSTILQRFLLLLFSSNSSSTDF